jgi:hypothetical protein
MLSIINNARLVTPYPHLTLFLDPLFGFSNQMSVYQHHLVDVNVPIRRQHRLRALPPRNQDMIVRRVGNALRFPVLHGLVCHDLQDVGNQGLVLGGRVSSEQCINTYRDSEVGSKCIRFCQEIVGNCALLVELVALGLVGKA